MKQNLSFLTALTMVIVLLATPLSLSSAIALEVTTTVPYTTTTTTWVWDCISTTYPTTTTSTTLNLTGPDGINPDYTTVTSTTATTDADTEPTYPVIVDLLSSSEFVEIGNISILANPQYGGEWLSADCYTSDGASVSILPTNSGLWEIDVLRYLHVTVTANVPFTMRATDTLTTIDGAFEGWRAEAFGTEPVDGWFPKGKYVGVIDLFRSYTDLTGEAPPHVNLTEFEVILSKPGSVTVGHIALSPESECTKTAPEIQTTTIPKFPTTTTTTGPDGDTLPTTHPVTVDLLSSASFTENGLVSILANPNYGGEWLSADCYTYDDASLVITMPYGGPWDVRTLRYLHITIAANLPFGLAMTDANLGTRLISEDWLADAVGAQSDSGYLPAGKYVGVIDLFDVYSDLLGEEASVVDLLHFELLLPKPGSITVGHIALSPDAVCTKPAPEIQTTTYPQFPTTDTTDADDTTTLPPTTATTTVVTHITTAPPTTTPSGDATTTQTAPHHNNGDADGNGFVNMLDCLLVYKVLAGDSQEAVDASQCDYSGDGVFDMLDCLILYNFLAFG